MRLNAKRILPLVVVASIPISMLAHEKPITSKGKHEFLRGHVIADVVSTGFGAGLGPKWVTFIFMAEGAVGKVVPVRINYAFYETDQLPSPSFWDYQAKYELDVKRDRTCDTTVEAISYEEVTDENGQVLPPLKVLQPAKGAPLDVLKPETALRCYVLWYGRYRRLDPTATP